MVALHFCDVTLTTKKLPNPAYPKQLITLGDHIRKRRLDLGMHQKDVAARVNATTSTVTNWEKGRTSPRLYFLPRVFKFLGYIPDTNTDTSMGEQIREYRRVNGLNVKKMSFQLGVDPGTVSRWEKEGRMPSQAALKKLKQLGAIKSRELGRRSIQ
jgi:transcriptional regulator with XRE-family HTH domain